MKPKLKTVSGLFITHWSFLAAMMVRGIELVGKLGLYMLAARILGAFEAGLFFLCNTWVTVGATVARAGFEKAAMRHIAAELAVGNGPEARRALVIGTFWPFIGGIAVSILTLAMAGPLANHVFSEPALVHPLMIAAASILPQALCICTAHALIGFGRGVAGQFVQNGVWPLVTFGALVIGIHSLDGILYAFAFGNLAGAILGGVLLVRERHRFRQMPVTTGKVENLPALWRTAWPLAIVEMIQTSLNSIPVLVLAAFTTAEVVGAFSVANRITMLIWVVIIAISTIAAPSFAASHRRGEWDELRAHNRKARLAIALFGVPAVIAMMAVPEWLLELIGPGFEIAAGALVIMSVGQLINCLLPSQDVMLAMTGKGRVLRWLNAGQLASCCILCAALIPAYGMTGAALATAIFIAQGAIGTTIAVIRLMPRAF